MKQILQSLKSGATKVTEVPVPRASRGSLLIQTSHTLVSAGTERMLVEFGKAGWIEKAYQQPDKVRMVLDKIKTDGLQPTLEAVFNKLDQPLPLGYCNTGRVAEVSDSVCGYGIGDRVISNGKHAEVVNVPINLCAKVPDNVPDEEAAFTVLGAIALQGVRLLQPTLGETVVVTGLGLIGLITVQLLRANGCRVLGLDFDRTKTEMAQQFGAETLLLTQGQNPLDTAIAYSRGRGVDGVIITAATKSSEPVHQAAQMCRKRGRIVLVGVAGLELSRDDFFVKELTFQVSASYGPGRHDPNYEEKGQDYPVGFVRWTEQRNFEAVLDMMSTGSLDVKPLVSHRFSIEDAEKAYDIVGGSEPSLGILLNYPGIELGPQMRTVELQTSERFPPVLATPSEQAQPPSISFIGSGNYATTVLIPAFKDAGVNLQSVASSNGVSGVHAGRKFGFQETTTDTDHILSDPKTDAVVITTRHNSHTHFVIQALKAGKHVFVEKPLCLTMAELEEIKQTHNTASAHHRSPHLMVGYNRRFAPQIQQIKKLLSGISSPKSFVMTVNAGAIPADHWTQDIDIGGGRIIGEACHFIDLLRFLSSSSILEWSRSTMDAITQDTLSINLTFADGSIGTIHYFANGAKSFPKERLEVFTNGRVLQLDNYRRLTAFGWPGFKKMNLWRQDKGQKACAKSFVDALRLGYPQSIPVDEIIETTRISIEVAGSTTS